MRRRLVIGTLTVALAVAGLPAGARADETTAGRVVVTSLDAAGRPVFTIGEAGRVMRAASVLSVETDVPVRALAGSDPYRSSQWDLVKIGATRAWGVSTGAGVTVAVIDTGVDGAHPDLRGKVLAGYDTIGDVAGGDSDENGHGTHVAGTIAALTGNGVGVSGVAPGARILPVKALGADGSGWMSDTAEGIVWAADHGAQVINMSLGTADQMGAVTAAVAYARSKGVTVVAAAGNERTKGSPVSYPAADPGVIAVAATDAADRYAYYSTAGAYVDLAAPGSVILNTFPTSLERRGYGTMSGTSMAAPHVAAAAALVKAYRPAATPDQIEQTLERSAVDLGARGFDRDYGYGRLDAAAALASLSQVVVSNVATRLVSYGTRTSTTFTASAEGRRLAGRAASICVSVSGGAWRCSAVRTDAAGRYTLVRTATGAFRARLQVPATAMSAAASATAGYGVQARATVVRSGKGAITVRVTGATGQKMYVQRYLKKRWTTVRTYSAASARKVTKLVRGGKYRVVVANTKSVRGVTSGTVKA
ncbi:S8 family serine peptidase [Actinoplanes aureus]|uniref:S8 family serine peptidase n=1 Tax=Actinoplanes aureus TaxID=2792083 RepID=UPI002814FFBE|nr:S8 family serine peptidase [Actinoplanes aureus]